MAAVTRDATIGFIGLGNLGQPMAIALMKDGWQLLVSDRKPAAEEACAAEGATVVSSNRQFSDCALVAIAVPDDAAVDEILLGSHGLFEVLPTASIVLIHSTIAPETAKRLAKVALEHGIELLDAPVSGGAQRALDGSLTMMIGGQADIVDRARQVLNTVAAHVVHVGPAGSGSATKLANQLMMFASLAGAYEAMELAAAYDVPEDAVLEAVRSSTGDSWITEHWEFFDETATAYDAADTPVSQRPWSKDLREVVAAAAERGLRMPVAELLAKYLSERVESHAHNRRQD